MRFTLAHILLWQACCLVLVATNFALSGGLNPLSQGIWSVAVCTGGCLLGVLIHRRRHRDVPIAPAKTLLASIAAMVLLAAVVGYFSGLRTTEICTYTCCKRYTREWGIVNIRFEECGEEARIIHDELLFRPSEHHWVVETTRGFRSVAYHMPQRQYPILNLNVNDLHKLSFLQPVGKCHALFRLDNQLDIKLFAKLRRVLFAKLRDRFGRLGALDLADSDAENVRLWWLTYEPLLRPIDSDAAFGKAAADWRENAFWAASNLGDVYMLADLDLNYLDKWNHEHD